MVRPTQTCWFNNSNNSRWIIVIKLSLCNFLYFFCSSLEFKHSLPQKTVSKENLRLLRWGRGSRNVKLTTHLHLLPRIIMCRALLPHPVHTSHIQALCLGTGIALIWSFRVLGVPANDILKKLYSHVINDESEEAFLVTTWCRHHGDTQWNMCLNIAMLVWRIRPKSAFGWEVCHFVVLL